MGGAVDPTYPLLPVANLLAASMLLFVLLTSFIRQNWNLGVALLSFWLFLENLNRGINAIIWADNADIKLYIYCDIVSRIQLIAYIVRPMATLIITRRLYIIASLQSVELPSAKQRRWNLVIEWTLGLIIPVIVAGPIYYINQPERFEVVEGTGCSNVSYLSIVYLLTISIWTVLIPLISVVVYYPKVALTFYRQNRDINRFLRSNHSVSHKSYYRIFALASIDMVLALPIGIVNIVLDVKSSQAGGGLVLYPGWTALHAPEYWSPGSYSYADFQASPASVLARQYFKTWTSPVLAFVVFGLFGLTTEARASYWHVVCTIGSWFGWKASTRAGNTSSPLGTMEFGPHVVQETISFDAEKSSHSCFINTTLVPSDDCVTTTSGGTIREAEAELDKEPHNKSSSASSEYDNRRQSASDAEEPANLSVNGSATRELDLEIQAQHNRPDLGNQTIP